MSEDIQNAVKEEMLLFADKISNMKPIGGRAWTHDQTLSFEILDHIEEYLRKTYGSF